jgi:hypothetical protein
MTGPRADKFCLMQSELMPFNELNRPDTTALGAYAQVVSCLREPLSGTCITTVMN